MVGVSLNPQGSVVFVLYSIHDVMKAEFALREKGVSYEMIPVPKEISSDCGMAIMVPQDRRPEVQRILSECSLEIKGSYLKTDNGYMEWKNDRD